MKNIKTSKEMLQTWESPDEQNSDSIHWHSNLEESHKCHS